MGRESSYYVIVVPGILGSTLVNQKGRVVYPHAARSLWLGFGKETRDDFQAGDVLKEFLWTDHYKSLENRLAEPHYIDDIHAAHTVWPFAYDWRRPIAPGEEPARLARLIREVPQGHRVAIVAHSMGGLLTKYALLHDEAAAARVDFFFSIGTPWLGSPEAYRNLRTGMQVTPWFTIPAARMMARTWPAVYQLAPSRPYFEDSPPPQHYLEMGEQRTPLSYEESRAEVDKLSPACSFSVYNEQGIQTWIRTPLPSHVTHCNLVGSGIPTVAYLHLHPYPRVIPWSIVNGDGTVPEKSAAWVRGPSGEARYVRDCHHQTLATAEPVVQFIRRVLATGQTQHSISGLSDQPSPPEGNVVSFDCPVDFFLAEERPEITAVLGDYVLNTAPDRTAHLLEGDRKVLVFPSDRSASVGVRATAKGTVTIRHLQFRDGRVQHGAAFHVELRKDQMAALDITPDGADLWVKQGEAMQVCAPATRNPQLVLDARPPEVIVKARGEFVTTTSDPIWFNYLDEAPYLDVEARGATRTLVRRKMGKRWRECHRIVLRPDTAEKVILRVTDEAGNETERTLHVGWAKTLPTVTIRPVQPQRPEGGYPWPLKLHLQVSAPVAAPICIEAVVNGQTEHIDLREPYLTLSEPGRTEVRALVKDAAGNVGPEAILIVMVSSEHEVAASGSRHDLVRDAALQGRPVSDAIGDFLVKVQAGGIMVDPTEPLPLAETYRVEVDMPGTPSDAQPAIYEFRLDLRPTWLAPHSESAVFSDTERFPCRFRLQGSERPEHWHSRVHAVVADKHGTVVLHLQSEYLPKLDALRFEVDCTALGRGDFQLEVRSDGVRLSSQEFSVI